LKKTTITKVCDRPHDREVTATTTRTVTVDGHDWEIDVCAKCARVVDAALASVVEHARPVARRRPRQPVRPQASRDRAAAIRAYWAEHQFEIGEPYKERGRIPASVIGRYDDAKAA
jgi:hypothetical protein